jgi:integrase
MAKHSSHNLRAKRNYMLWLKDAKGHSEASIDKAAAAIDRYEDYVKGADFRAFHVEKPRGFKRHLTAARNAKTGAPLGRGTLDATLRDVMAFFRWLADQPGYRSRVRHPDVTYFTPDRRSTRAAHGGCWKPHPSPEQLQHVLAQMPSDTAIERRNRAAVAFLFLTGSRETAAISIRLSHIDLAARCVHFDGRTVDTKFGKSFTTTFFPVGEAAERIVAEWIAELRRDHLWGPSDPFLPRTRIALGPDGGFQVAGLDRAPWAKAKPLAQLFKDAFAAAGLPPFPPHRVRDTIAEMAREFCRSPEDYKAWSQNLGHADVLTTFTSYGSVAPGRQADVMRAITRRGPAARSGEDELFEPWG